LLSHGIHATRELLFSGDVLVRKADIRNYSKYCLKKEENTNHTSPS
jgi:hypothetical protein